MIVLISYEKTHLKRLFFEKMFMTAKIGKTPERVQERERFSAGKP